MEIAKYWDFTDSTIRTTREDFLKLLGETSGFEVNKQDSRGSTALHYAARSQNLGCAHTLVGLGAQLDIRNEDGLIPFDKSQDTTCYMRRPWEMLPGAGSWQFLYHAASMQHAAKVKQDRIDAEKKAKQERIDAEKAEQELFDAEKAEEEQVARRLREVMRLAAAEKEQAFAAATLAAQHERRAVEKRAKVKAKRDMPRTCVGCGVARGKSHYSTSQWKNAKAKSTCRKCVMGSETTKSQLSGGGLAIGNVHVLSDKTVAAEATKAAEAAQLVATSRAHGGDVTPFPTWGGHILFSVAILALAYLLMRP
jgi:hypothetical protein